MWARILFSFLCFFFVTAPVGAANLDLSAVTLVDKDTGADTYDIKFNLSWEHSWRISGAPSVTSNWDAAWIFVKFSKKTSGVWQPWAHATLLNTGNVVPAGSTMDFADNTDDVGKYKGVFMYRSDPGLGSNSWADAEIRWDYAADGVADSEVIKIKVFALEMVYIPEGSFYIGDTDSDTFNNFRPLGGSGPVHITSTLSNAFTADVGAYSGDTVITASGIRAGGSGLDTNNDGTGDNTLFPTGYHAFYIMKYEASQKQYVDFLNTLNGTQQSARASATTAGNFHNDDNTTNTPQNRGGIKCVVAPAGAAAGVYANDLNTGNAVNSTDDGQSLAANWLSWMDGAAYADWAALRPITELEYEKAARGPKVPVDDEYAWGSTSITQATGISAAGSAGELPANGTANCAYGNHASVQGPVRVGMFATAGSNRVKAGASYYGVLELSANLSERPVTAGNGTPNAFGGRDFTGLHGDGSLAGTGFADVNAWPGDSNGNTAGGTVTGATGSGFRGSGWISGASFARVSQRYDAANTSTTRLNYTGARCARTAP